MRLFVALCLPEPLCAELVRLQERLPAGRPLSEDSLHLTLAFLGDQPESVLEPLHDALSGLRAGPITLRLSEPALYGGKWGAALGLGADGGPALRDLQARVGSRITGCGVVRERQRFRPHVTLARLRGKQDPAGAIAALQGVHFGPVLCAAFGLFASHLRPEGAEYEPLALFALV